MDLKALQTEFETTMTAVKSAVEKQDGEIKANGEAHKKTAMLLDSLDKKISDLLADIEAKDARLVELEKKAARGDVPGNNVIDFKSPGELYLASDVYADVKSRNRANGISYQFARKDITSAAGSAAALLQQYRNPTIFADPNRPFFVTSLLKRIPVTDNAIEIMRELAFDNQAGPQFQSGQTPDNELVPKNKSNITFSLETIPVRTLAHYIIASRQILADAPRLRAYIDGRLMYGLNLEVDAQVLYGDGTDQNLTGLMVDPDVTDIGAMAWVDSLGTSMLEQIRTAITACQVNHYFNISAVLLHPIDWQVIELAKGSDGHYIWVSVPNGAEARVWRVPVIVTTAIDQGEFILGDWQMGATLYDREQMSIRTAEQHADLFVRNGVVILAEERLALGIELPKAFAKGSFSDVTTL